jgi:hypothetical protein
MVGNQLLADLPRAGATPQGQYIRLRGLLNGAKGEDDHMR